MQKYGRLSDINLKKKHEGQERNEKKK